MATTTRSRKAAATPPAMHDPLDGPEQLGLSAAPVAPNEDDEARKAIALINTGLSEFDKIQAGLAELRKRHENVVYDFSNDDQAKQGKEAIKEVSDVRHAVERHRKAAKAPVLNLGRNIDEKAKQLTEAILVLETPLVQQKEKADRAEADRVAALEKRILAITEAPRTCMGKTVEQIEQILADLQAIDLATFAELRIKAAKAHVTAELEVQQHLTLARQAARATELEAQNKKLLDDQAAAAEKIRTGLRATIARLFTSQLEMLPMCRTADRVQRLLESVDAGVVDDSFGDLEDEARAEKNRVLGQIATVRDQKRREEKAAAPPPPLAGPMLDAEIKLGTPTVIQGPAPAPTPRPFSGVGFTRFIPSPTPPTPPSTEAFLREKDAEPLPWEDGPAADEARPTDGELLQVLVDHYRRPPAAIAAWLDTFDADSAIAQLALPLTNDESH